MSSSRGAKRLPPSKRLKYLSVSNPREQVKGQTNSQMNKADPCTLLMSELFSCWAGTALNSPECAKLEVKMKACYDNSKLGVKGKSTFNYHAARLFPILQRKPHD
ncbi:hypothetical protein BZA70DRAFT_270692 [Myxozyma melibiosi]|uniref:37S ribosomal protein mrp10, mitochondrial n=1 Tax=Myxozyma melibiosi TaxID=54550 RepID=A0ABR1FBH7_9ASCO